VLSARLRDTKKTDGDQCSTIAYTIQSSPVQLQRNIKHLPSA